MWILGIGPQAVVNAPWYSQLSCYHNDRNGARQYLRDSTE